MKLFVTALEPSSNLHLNYLLKELQGIELLGIHDPNLGFNPIYTPKDFSVMGFVDVFKKIIFFKKALDECVKAAENADKVLLMDSSGFNIPLAKKLKERYPKKELIYYILPQAWAWKRYRAKQIDALCDTLCAILPFELNLYTKAKYVGHPLLDEIERFRYDVLCNDTVAFLPGSRKGEITKLMPIFRELKEALPDKRALLVIPPFFDEERIAGLYGDITGFEITRNTHLALLSSEFAFICSGTATLEAALIGTPFALVYMAKQIDFFIAKRFVKLKYSGLANNMLDFEGRAKMHDEFFQKEVNVNNLLESLRNKEPKSFLEDSIFLRNHLKRGSAKKVAEIVSTNKTLSNQVIF